MNAALAPANSPKGAVSVVNPKGTEETGTDRPAAPIAKPKRQRKSTVAALQAADAAGYARGRVVGFDDGFLAGLRQNHATSKWPGAAAAFTLAGIAFGLGAWIF